MAGWIAQTALGLLGTLAINGAVLYCGHVVARRVWPTARASTRLAANGLIALAIALLMFHVLALLQSLVLLPAVVCASLLGCAFHGAWGRWRGLGDDLSALVDWARQIKDSRGAFLLVGVGVLVLSAAYRAAVWPPLSWDSLMYHSYFAGSWVQAGQLVHFSLPPAVAESAHFPFHFEAFVAWVMLPFHGDLLVNFANFPLLALGAVSIYSLCRQFDLDVYDSSLAAGLVCVSPAMMAYITTQYNDIQVMSLLSCSALFAVRYVKRKEWKDAAASFLASGLAAGTKYTALPVAGMLGAVVVLAAVKARVAGGRGERMGRCRRALLVLALGIGVSVCAGGHKYVTNWLETGNPLYPVGVSMLGKSAFPRESPVAQMMRSHGQGGTWVDDVRQAYLSITYTPDAGRTPVPVTWGPKLPLIVFLALLALFLSKGAAWRTELWCLTLCWVVPILVFYVDSSANTVLARRIWPVFCCRFLGMPVAMMTVCAVIGVSRSRPDVARHALRAVLCTFLLYDVLVMCRLPKAGWELFALAWAVPITVSLLWPLFRLPVRLPARWLPSLAAIVVAFVVDGASLQWVRGKTRYDHYATDVDLNPIPTAYVRGWAFCDIPGDPKTIALASYGRDAGHRWFFYPLMGRELQNRVLYVPVDHPIAVASLPNHEDAPGHAEPSIWLENLQEAQVTHVFVQFDTRLPLSDAGRTPVEWHWMEGRPEVFRLVDSGDHYRIYSVHWPTRAPH